MSSARFEVDLPMTPRRADYAAIRGDKIELTQLGRNYRKAVRQKVRSAGKMTFRPTSLSSVVHDSGQLRMDLSEAEWVVSDALRYASTMVSTRQIDALSFERGERKSVAGVVVVLEGEA
ncbi:MAG: hypothetical protein AAFV77_07295 [Planctomycetota bacterium]